ncbi:hypothetical protein FK519_30200, partial [Klebsiella pneumoniae]|nr:hypothetical protein [Klebsiella pneumoniae]
MLVKAGVTEVLCSFPRKSCATHVLCPGLLQRVGHGDKNHADADRSPVFLQFIDCV